MKNPDLKTALEMYYTKPEISNEDIRLLFDVGKSTAIKMKREVKQKMAEKGVRCFLPNHINTRLAFEVWGIDVKLYEENLKQLQRLKLET